MYRRYVLLTPFHRCYEAINLLVKLGRGPPTLCPMVPAPSLIFLPSDVPQTCLSRCLDRYMEACTSFRGIHRLYDEFD